MADDRGSCGVAYNFDTTPHGGALWLLYGKVDYKECARYRGTAGGPSTAVRQVSSTEMRKAQNPHARLLLAAAESNKLLDAVCRLHRAGWQALLQRADAA